jgi:hypothetical protein
LPADSPLAAVHVQLAGAGVPTRLIDQRDVLDTRVRLSVGSALHGRVWVRGEELVLDEVTAAYARPYDSTRLPHLVAAGAGSQAWRQAAAVDAALMSWCSMTRALIVNPFEAMASNSSKPFQLEQIRRLGWSVPETLVTTDPALAMAFWERHGEVIYKSVSGVRSQVSRLRSEHRARFDNIRSCPTQFQQHIAGTDFRVHVVGTELFVCEIESAMDDYRYAPPENVSSRRCRLPRQVEDDCRALASALHLWLAGIDLRRTPAGEWVCFEVNGSPGFTGFGPDSTAEVAQAVVRLLARGAVEPAAQPAQGAQAG